LNASWVFYAWHVRVLALLLLSIACNYGLSRAISHATANERKRAADALVAAGVALNHCVIGVFKYANFFVSSLDVLPDVADVKCRESRRAKSPRGIDA
jgi:alginate O-acetyltransferase complex protein AlgI